MPNTLPRSLPGSSPVPEEKERMAAKAKYDELAARYDALKQRHRLVLHNQLVAEEVRATGPTLCIQMRERFDEVEEERKGLESELSACKRELQEYKDKLLEWCASYMEAMTRVKHVEEQYKLDRREWENDLKDTRAQRDQFKAAAESYRLDRFEEDRQWQEEKAMSILGGAAGTGKGKRDVPDHEAQEARKKLKGQGDKRS